MYPVRKFKKKLYKQQSKYAPSKIRELDYYTGREVITTVPVDFTLGISTSGTLFTDFAGTNYINFASILGANGTFVNDAQVYAKYKIMNISLSLTPTDNLAGYTLTCTNVPAIACGCFPSCLNLTLGPLVKDNDNSFMFYGGLNFTQSRQWNFPDNFLTDKNYGIGTWNNSLEYNLIIGEIAFIPVVSISAISTPRIIAACRVRFTVKWGLFSI